MTLLSLWHFLWNARLLLQTALLVWMIARQFYREFPLFVVYTGDVVVQTIIDKAMIRSPSVTGNQYFVVYTIGGIVSAVFSFAVLYEIFKRAFRDYPALRELGTNLFRITLVSFLLIALVLAWIKPAAELRMQASKIDFIDQAICIMQCGMVLVLLLFSKKIGVSLQSRTFGIALGFGILASVGLAAFAIRARIETPTYTRATNLVTLSTMAASLCTVAVWTAYVLRPETQSHAALRVLPASDLESWNQELQRLLR